ncbi:efflux RND transporter periplasmic adaptor subunit [Flavobacterium sp. LS1R47]|uniref:Efflux RND transporter periplasmic adaptor subunit n=1 Tax=Flavobacterium frigoritolerans TaxID=2987686 RepID=A0A9X3C1X6_9FLAO|nr:efflux RND transporter periplasmic adaptor subunit [Flavobacterium frigoritolerans]MCV9933176.1 efflux RND transporter periplasmic adaptor subunit [Flavobacterium frigoritolerans]
MKKTIAILFIGTLSMVSCNTKSTEQIESPTAYPTLTLKAQEANVSVEYPTTLEGEQTVEIRSKIDGYIEQVYVEEGSVVTKGKPLFKIDANSYLQEVNNKKAAVLAAEASLETAVIQTKRTAALAEKKIINTYELTSAKNIERVKRAELSQANADLSAAKSKLGFTNIVSPINGVVGSLPYKIGSLVSSSAPDPITTVANTKNIFAYFSLSQQQLNSFLGQYSGNQLKDKFKNMPEVSLLTADGEMYPLKGKIQTLSGVLNASTGAANFKAVFPNPAAKLWSGASATIIIPTQLEDAILVPKKAVFELQGRFFVFTVDAKNVVHNTEIKIRNTATEKEYVVTEGVKSGDNIVTDGIGNLRDGVKIAPIASLAKK